jgi:hypothetical protein
MAGYTYDLLRYHDLSDSVNDRPLQVGDDAGEMLGAGFEGMAVVAVGPPVHGDRTAAVVVAFGKPPMPEMQAMLERQHASATRYQLVFVHGSGSPALMESLGLYDAAGPLEPGAELVDGPGHRRLTVQRILTPPPDQADASPIAFCSRRDQADSTSL